MNPLILTIIIALATFILAIFGATWLNANSINKGTDTAKDEIKELINARFDGLRAEFRAEIAPLRTEVANLNNRVDRLERQLEAIFKPVFPKSGD